MIEIKANEKYNATRLDERHRDHALYVAFAPLESPRIALAIIVENAGFGAGAAAPIARRVFDYMISGQYPSEADIAATQLGQSTAPIGVTRPIDAVPLPGATVDGAATARAEPVAVPLPAAPASAPAPTGKAPGGDLVALRRDRGGPPMSAVFDSRSLWQRARPIFTGYDVPLVLAVGPAGPGRAGDDVLGRVRSRHALRRPRPQHGCSRSSSCFLAAQIPPQQLMRLAIPLYVVGVILLVATALPGSASRRKARRAGSTSACRSSRARSSRSRCR